MAKKKAPKTPNPVSKHMHTFNTAQTHDCRKSKMKAGYQKHKSGKSPDLAISGGTK